MSSAPGVIGPSLDTRNDVALDIPSCVQIRTPKDEAEFREFIAKIVFAARKAWIAELAPPNPGQGE